MGIFAAALAAQAATGQALPPQLLALYPQQTGELVFVDARAMRGSPHYPQIKAQVLPERFRQLEQWVRLLGIDFDSEVRQLSWGFTGDPESAEAGFVGIAEGTYRLAEVGREAKKLKLTLSRHAGFLFVTLGATEQGRDFVFAFVDSDTALFGFRDEVQAMLDRRAQGGPGLPANRTMTNLIRQVNGRAPVWLALDNRFSTLAVKQMLPEAANLPGFDTLATRVESASLRFEIGPGLRSSAAVRCQNPSDALFLSTLMQLGLSYQTTQLGQSNPDLARVLGDLKLDRRNEQLDVTLAIGERDLVTLLQKNTFALKF